MSSVAISDKAQPYFFLICSASLEEISNEYDGKLSIIKVNIDENPITPSTYGIRGIPTLLLFKNSELVSQKVGAFPKSALLEWVDSNI